jgi:hypothetical protein
MGSRHAPRQSTYTKANLPKSVRPGISRHACESTVGYARGPEASWRRKPQTDGTSTTAGDVTGPISNRLQVAPKRGNVITIGRAEESRGPGRGSSQIQLDSCIFRRHFRVAVLLATFARATGRYSTPRGERRQARPGRTLVGGSGSIAVIEERPLGNVARRACRSHTLNPSMGSAWSRACALSCSSPPGTSPASRLSTPRSLSLARHSWATGTLCSFSRHVSRRLTTCARRVAR